MTLQAKGEPPKNLCRDHPRITRLMSHYSLAKTLSALPNPGGLLDQRPDHIEAFSIFGAAEVEHDRQK